MSKKPKVPTSLFEERIGQVGIATSSSSITRNDIPDAQIKAMALEDVNEHGGPENLKNLKHLSDEKNQLYMDTFNEAQNKILNRREGFFSDEDIDTWKERSENYIEKQKDWMGRQKWNKTESTSTNTSTPDPFEESPPPPKNTNDGFNDISSADDMWANEEPSLAMNDQEPPTDNNDFDDIDEFEDPFV